MSLELQQLFSLSHTHFTTAVTLGRNVSHTFPLQVQLSCPRMPTLQIISPHQFRTSVPSKCKETVDRLQDCPELLLLLTSKPQRKKTIWCGHAPLDINNWKVSWSFQIYFREKRVIQWFFSLFFCIFRNTRPSSSVASTRDLPCSIHSPTYLQSVIG